MTFDGTQTEIEITKGENDEWLFNKQVAKKEDGTDAENLILNLAAAAVEGDEGENTNKGIDLSLNGASALTTVDASDSTAGIWVDASKATALALTDVTLGSGADYLTLNLANAGAEGIKITGGEGADNGDKIDLSAFELDWSTATGTNGWLTYGESNGPAVITVADKGTITLIGVTEGLLTADNFKFADSTEG